MNLDPLVRSARLHDEAGELIKMLRLEELLHPSGKVYLTGSYFLDLMVYPDIDLYVPMTGIPNIFAAAGQMASHPAITRVTFENEAHAILPGGLFLNLRVNLGDWERLWKVDIWWLDQELIFEKLEIMHQFQLLLTPDLREQIIRYKTSMLNRAGRTPQYSGYFIYKAILMEGLRDSDEISAYLVANGINLN